MAEDSAPSGGRRGLTPEQRRRRRRRRRQRLRKEARKDGLFGLLNPNNVLNLADKDGKRGQKSDRNPNRHPDRHRNEGSRPSGNNNKNRKNRKRRRGGGGGGAGGGGAGGGGAGGGSTSQNGMAYYGLGDFKSPSRKDAQSIVGAEMNKLIRELLRDAKTTKSGMQYDVNKANALYDRTKGDLEYIYGEADDFAKAQNQKIADRFSGNATNLQNLYQQFQQQQQGTTDANRQAILDEQSRLGIQQAGTGRFNEDAARMQQLAAQQQQNNMTNNSTAASMSDEIGNLLRSMGRSSQTSAVGRAMNDRNDFIQDTRQTGRQQLNDILSKIQGVRSDRGNQVNQLHMQMQQNAFQQWAEMQQADFNNQLAANQFNLDVSRLNSSNLWNKAKLRQEAKRQAAIRRAQRRQQQSVASGVARDTTNLLSGIADVFQ